MKCHDCGARVVSAGLVYCPRCSAHLSKKAALPRTNRFGLELTSTLFRAL